MPDLEALGLYVCWEDGPRFFEPNTESYLLAHDKERAGRMAAEARADEERTDRMAAEARVAELEEKLQRLRGD